MNFPCPIREPCLDDANPVQNLSSEAPDKATFYAYGSAPGSYSGASGTTSPQPGHNWLGATDCDTRNGSNVCISPVNAEDAALCVNRLENICQPPTGTPPAGPPTAPDGTRLFQSNATSCTVNCADGSPFTFVVPFGAFVAASQILADRQAMSYACRQAQLKKVCFSTLSLGNGCYGQPYNGHATVSGTGPYTFTIVAGALPPGLAMSGSGNSITISGTPTMTGFFTFGIKAVGGSGLFVVKTFTLAVIGFTNTNPSNFTNNSAYSFQFSASGGTAPRIFTLSGGSLPSGLSMHTNGLVTGTPSGATSTSASIKVTDATGAFCIKAFPFATAAKTGFAICNWNQVKPLLTMSVDCLPSVDPEWDGIFDLTDFMRLPVFGCPVDNTQPFWYFITQAVNGKSVAVSDCDFYNNPNPAICWQNQCCYTILAFDPIFQFWYLDITCSCASDVWYGEMNSTNPNDPSGTYTLLAGDSAKPTTIEIRAVGYQCCADVGDPVPANFNPASPTRVRIHDLAGFVSALGACPGCVASASPAWDGTLPVKCTADVAHLDYYLAGTACNSSTTPPAMSLAGFRIQTGLGGDNASRIFVHFISGASWQFQVICFDTPDKIMWSGKKLVGDNPVGRYIRESGASGGVAAGPACVDIESY